MGGLVSSLNQVTLFCFLASYGVTLGLECVRLIRQSTVNRVLMLGFAVAGLVAHTAYLMVRSQHANLPPLLSSVHDWLLVLAWLAMMFYVVLMSLDRDVIVGPFLLPLVLVLITASAFVKSTPQDLLDAEREWKMLHASLLVFGMAGVASAFILSLMYLVQHRRLKTAQTMINGLTLPNLQKLARWNWWAVVLAVPLLTLGMATGIGLILSSESVAPMSWVSDPVIIGNSVGWLVMMVLFVWLLSTRRPTGKQVAWLTLGAGGFLLATILSLSLLSGRVLDTQHGGGPVESSFLVVGG